MGLHLKLDVLAYNHKKEIDAKNLEILDLKANRRQVLRENNFGMANTHMKFKKLVLKKVKQIKEKKIRDELLQTIKNYNDVGEIFENHKKIENIK